MARTKWTILFLTIAIGFMPMAMGSVSIENADKGKDTSDKPTDSQSYFTNHVQIEGIKETQNRSDDLRAVRIKFFKRTDIVIPSYSSDKLYSGHYFYIADIKAKLQIKAFSEFFNLPPPRQS
ncbi:MAG: hypothetical protein JEZ07_07790 [Phycisphaerae bacterium]|nr:hypothetical protein [Phycisphaerae bacterium]